VYLPFYSARKQERKELKPEMDLNILGEVKPLQEVKNRHIYYLVRFQEKS
jgi:hypothetical protein